NASTYTLTTNQSFTNGGLSNGADFSSFGNSTITLQASGIARYSTLINITDSNGASSSTTVTFNNSGANAYTNSFSVSLTNATPGLTSFSGSSSFGVNNLQITTIQNIL